MIESQNIEYKTNWRDEYLKWICGFANAEGGEIFIGKNDDGSVIELMNVNELLELIPNKVRDILGIMVDVNLHLEDGKYYIEIKVDPYPYPVNYKGQYHYRSGSTKQELKGHALNRFLLEKVGKRWDSVPVPDISLKDLKKSSIDRYKAKALKSKRIDEEILNDSSELLLDNLHLFDSSLLKRAAIMLFHPEPEHFISGWYIKIGFFKTDDDLLFHDEVHGNLIDQIDRAYDLIKTKYTTYSFEYSETSRLEHSPFPEKAIREALLNAIAHKDYSDATPVQISIYPDHIVFWNPGRLPDQWTTSHLTEKHPSIPFNPDIANALFRCGDIESWGRGTIKMINECVEHEILPPDFNVEMSGFMVSMFSNPKSLLSGKGYDNTLIDIVIDTLEQGQTSNTRVRKICEVSKATATRYLDQLEGNILSRIGETGRGTYYIIKGLTKGSNKV